MSDQDHNQNSTMADALVSESREQSILQRQDYYIELSRRKRFSEDEWEEICNWRNKMGAELARHVYHLTNSERETEIQIYIDTINSYILEQDSDDNIAILEIAQNCFRERYGIDIKNRGQSPELLDQIVHRTGAHTREQFKKLLQGFDVKLIANSLWNALVSRNSNSIAKLEQEIELLTAKQRLELDFEFARIPAIKISEQLHHCLIDDSDLNTGYGIILENELVENFRHRTKEEIQEIIAVYDDLYHCDHTSEKYPSFAEALQNSLKGACYDRALKILEGFNAEELALQLFTNIQAPHEVLDRHDNQHGLHFDFAGNFREDYSDCPASLRELLVQHENDKLLDGLNSKHFEAVNKILSENYDLSLDPTLYQCNRKTSLRERALQLFQGLTNTSTRKIHRKDEDYLSLSEMQEVKKQFRLAVRADLSELIQIKAREIQTAESLGLIRRACRPLSRVNVLEMFEFEEQFKSLSNVELRKFCAFQSNRILKDSQINAVSAELAQILSGHRYLTLNPELETTLSTVKQEITRSSQAISEIFPSLVSLLDLVKACLSADTIQLEDCHKLLATLAGLSKDRLELLELAYQRRFSRALLSDLRLIAPAKIYLQAYLLLSGLQLRKQAEAICSSISAVLDCYHYSPSEIEAVINACQRLGQKNRAVLLAEAQTLSPDQYWKAAIILMKPDAHRLRLLLCADHAFSDRDSKQLQELLTKPDHLVLALEAAYNYQYSDFARCHNDPNLTMLQQLRVLANRATLSRSGFARSLLLIENTSPEIAEALVVLLDRLESPATAASPELYSQLLGKIRSLFVDHKSHLPLIRKTFAALDAALNLRERIHNLKITLTDRNLLLLLMDGYDPIFLAQRVHQIIENSRPESIESALLELLCSSDEAGEHGLIPKHPNWTAEMFQQIRVRYQQIFGDRLITNLRRKGLSLKNSKLSEIAERLYGPTAIDAFKLRKLITHCQKNGVCKQAENSLMQIFSEHVPALTERTIDLYEACFSTQAHGLQISTDIAALAADEYLKQQLNTLSRSALNWDKIGADLECVSDDLELHLSQVA
jgi:hypothetical protein